MQLEEEKLYRLKQQRSEQAIALAMQGRWSDAVALNREIIEQFPKDVEAWNRLGRAYIELGEYPQAKEAYGRTLERDPYNAIARKNLQRLAYLKESKAATVEARQVDPQHFIEEIGKAGVVNLYALAPQAVLARTIAGDRVNLKVSGANLVVENSHGEYLGQVELRHSQRLMRLMDGGNRYDAAVVAAGEGAMTVMVRETYQDPSQAGRLSFPPRGLEEFRPYLADRRMKVDSEDKEPGYTIIGGEEGEVLAEEGEEGEEDENSEEE
ncbi:MAG: tetratricopeptide repeat protein [Chloroflexota bacterium]